MVDNLQFDVYFRGDIVPGQTLAEVKERLAELFKLESAQVDQLFSGRPTAIRRNLDETSAKKYEQALLKIGAVAELRPAKVEDVSPVEVEASLSVAPAVGAVSESSEASVNDGISLAPVGSDVLRPDERASIEAEDVDVSSLTLEPSGSEILHENEKQIAETTPVDTSHLEVLPK